jgi:hypothetical protein
VARSRVRSIGARAPSEAGITYLLGHQHRWTESSPSQSDGLLRPKRCHPNPPDPIAGGVGSEIRSGSSRSGPRRLGRRP